MMPKTITKASISLETAEKMLKAAQAAANGIKVPMVIAIVDESGVLKAFTRMDGAPMISAEV